MNEHKSCSQCANYKDSKKAFAKCGRCTRVLTEFSDMFEEKPSNVFDAKDVRIVIDGAHVGVDSFLYDVKGFWDSGEPLTEKQTAFRRKVDDVVGRVVKTFAEISQRFSNEAANSVHVFRDASADVRQMVLNKIEALFDEIEGDNGLPTEVEIEYLLKLIGCLSDYFDVSLDDVRDVLFAKNLKYGNSALEPVRVLSTSGPAEQIKVRIDDKIKRLQNRKNDEDEDIPLDLIGYLVILVIALEGVACITAPDANE